MDALRDPSLEVSRQSAEALAKIGPPALPGLLAMAKQETNDHARASLSLAIGRMRTPGVVSQVLPLLAEKDVPLRITACKALGMLGSPEAVGPLFSLRSDAPYDVLKAAEEALVNLGPAAVDPLAEKLGDKNSWVREDAASILGRIGSPALPRLAALVQDEDPKRAMAASNALALMAWGEQRLPGAVAVLDRAVESHDLRAIAGGYYYFVRADPSPETRALLVQALNKYGSKEMAEEMLDSGHQDLVRAARTWARAHGYDIIQLPGSPQ
jgi:HEAT repeat protein